MIHNDNELRVAQSQLVNLQNSIAEIEKSLNSEEVDKQSALISKNALQIQVNRLSAKIQEYKGLVSNELSVERAGDFQTFRSILIKDRIASHVSQQKMAEHLNLDLATFIRLEADNFDGASFQMLRDIASYLDTPYDPKLFETLSTYSRDTLVKIPITEMDKRKWLDGIVSDDKVRTFFENSGLHSIDKVLNRQTHRQNAKINNFALAFWYARVNQLASYDQYLPDYDPDNLSEEFLKQLRELSDATDGPVQAIFKLRSIGIIVVIEPHLDETHIDGAAFFMDQNRPVVALTLRHDRIDNFWFVLFHELAHIKLHLWGEGSVIFDDLDTPPGNDEIERQADEFATRNLIPDENWENALFLMKPSKIGIEKFARQLSIHPAIVAGRIRRENTDYTKFSDMVGNGLVRKLLLP